ncbi:hypothetical protein AAZX31_06G124600 [Glycine max]
MTIRKITGLNFVLGMVCVAFLLTSGSANMISESANTESADTICKKGGFCPNTNLCNNICLFWGFNKGGSCTILQNENLCCCTS